MGKSCKFGLGNLTYLSTYYKTIKQDYLRLLEYILDSLWYVLFIRNNVFIVLSINLVLIIKKLWFYNLSGLNVARTRIGA